LHDDLYLIKAHFDSWDTFFKMEECALMSVSNLPFETQVLMPPDGGKWITKNQ